MKSQCLIPGCDKDAGGLDFCTHHAITRNYNEILMSPQPLLELKQVSSNHLGKWGRWERGEGVVEFFLNQPSGAVGVKKDKETGKWYWLIS